MDCLHTPELNQDCGQSAIWLWQVWAMLHTVVMGAQQCFHGPETGALVPCHMAVFCLLFYLVLMGGEGSALLLKMRSFVNAACPTQLVGFAALRGSEQVTALLWNMLSPPSFAEVLGDSCCISCLFSLVLASLIANKIGKGFFSGATRPPFSTSEELEEWIWIYYPVFQRCCRLLQLTPSWNRLECNYLVYLKSRPFKTALNLSLCTLSYHLSLSVEHGLDLMQPHHNTHLQLPSLFTLLGINLNSLVCFSLHYVSGNIDLFFYTAVDPTLAIHWLRPYSGPVPTLEDPQCTGARGAQMNCTAYLVFVYYMSADE